MSKLHQILILGLLLVIAWPGVSEAADVFDTSYVIFHFHGPDPSAQVGQHITTLGDINGDGFSDIGISRRPVDDMDGVPESTFLFYGNNVRDAVPELLLAGYGATAIDLTGDGINEIVTCRMIDPGWTPIGMLYFYRGHSDSVESEPYDSLFPAVEPLGERFTNWGFGWTFNTAYVDSDSLGDILTLKPNTLGGPTLYYYSGAPALDTVADWSFKIENSSHTFKNQGFIDFDGDGNLDIHASALARGDTLSYIYIFLGPDFAATPDVVIGHPEGRNPFDKEWFWAEGPGIGDVDGDGWNDLGVLFDYTPLIYLCGPGADTLYDHALELRAFYISAAGDINDDGYNDILSGDYNVAYGGIWMYLGGEELDTICDEHIYRKELPPLFLNRIGYRVSSAGDFNGDGIDDYMFSCQSFLYGEEPGDVFVVKGSADLVTGIEDAAAGVLPETFDLKQNYPNPFNPSTTIEFTLKSREHVRLDLFNVLGRHVASLLDEELSPGNHRIVWDAKTCDGKPFASGVYFYRLRTDYQVDSKKMMLVK